jgi:hypothetical protein
MNAHSAETIEPTESFLRIYRPLLPTFLRSVVQVIAA